MDICRACLCTDRDLSQVDENFILSYNLLTNLNVKPYDSMPKCFCRYCIKFVRNFITFRDKCISSESIFKEKCVNNKVNECEMPIAIKKEVDGILDENNQYELLQVSVKDEVIKEESVVLETEILDEKEINPLELDEVVKRSRGRPKKKLKITKKQTELPQKPKIMCNEFYCGLCDESLLDADQLNKHLVGHRTDKCCGICSKTFENWTKLLAHRVTHTFKKYCHLCLRRFNSITRLEEHYLSIHSEEKLKEMCCEHCRKTFTCRVKLSRHLETHNVECHICPEIFPSKRLLRVHLRTHDTKKRYECDQCEYTAIYAAVLATHKIRRHKKFSCKTCDRKFSDGAKLENHICKDKSKLCPICGQRIYDSFNRHLNSHKDVKTFKCEKCPATYKNRLSLKVHMDRHDNNPTHVCDYCGRKFYYPMTLCKHRRVHTGEKPYVCKVCGKRFTGNTNLRVHMKVHGIVLISKKNKDPAEVPEVVQATVPV